MDAKTDIATALAELFSSPQYGQLLSAQEIANLLEAPKDRAHGDIAFPCFSLAKVARKAPPMIARQVSEELEKIHSLSAVCSRIEPVGPYVNFYLNIPSVGRWLQRSASEGSFLGHRALRGEHMMVEYSQPNTHKAFHVGHIRCAALGDTLIRLAEWQGYKVTAVNYIGDEGTHVARCLWYYQKHFSGPTPSTNLGEFLGLLYVKATELLDLETLTRAPFPGVTAARILSVVPHPADEKWRIVELETSCGARTVVCGVTEIEQHALVAYAPPGLRVSGKAVGTVNKKGVESQGMICSRGELGLVEKDDAPGTADQLVYLPKGCVIGSEVAEIYRREGVLADGESVLATVQDREREVSKVLQGLESGDPEMKALWDRTKGWSMAEFQQVYQWLDCRFDHYFYESSFGEEGKALVREFQTKGVFVESDGAIGADLREQGLGFCILIKSDGTATYACRDLALARKKFDQFGVDRSLYVVDAGQTLHFQQVFACLRLMGYEQAERCYHHGYGQVIGPDGKMSSRKGTVILFSELKERLITKITAEFLEKYRNEWSDEEIATAAYRLALATIRYGMLKQENNSVIVFDLDEWSSRSGNTGPYLMYAYARIQSIGREAIRREGVNGGTAGVGEDSTADLWTLLSDESEEDLIRHLYVYPEVVERSGVEFSPNYLCNYLYDLSKRLNRVYTQCPVLTAPSVELRTARLTLIGITGQVLKHGLDLLGIETVERM